MQVPGVVEDEAFAAEIFVPGLREFRVLGAEHLALILKPSTLPTCDILYVFTIACHNKTRHEYS